MVQVPMDDSQLECNCQSKLFQIINYFLYSSYKNRVDIALTNTQKQDSIPE